jgi:hypothetical protein
MTPAHCGLSLPASFLLTVLVGRIFIHRREAKREFQLFRQQLASIPLDHPTPGATAMGSDRLFRDHPDNPRKRRKRLIHYLHPALHRAAKLEIAAYPPDLKAAIHETADRAGVSPVSVLLYALIGDVLAKPKEERNRVLRESGLFPGATDDELHAVIAKIERRLKAEMRANRRPK